MIQILLVQNGRLLMCVLSDMLERAQVQRGHRDLRLGLLFLHRRRHVFLYVLTLDFDDITFFQRLLLITKRHSLLLLRGIGGTSRHGYRTRSFDVPNYLVFD